MILSMINLSLCVAFGYFIGQFRARRGVPIRLWYALLVSALFVAGLNLVEIGLGLRW